MSANESLAERIQQRFGSLPAKQQSVARVLAGHPSTVALSSLSDIAAQAGVDAATVVRTCQTLDYSGWRDLLASLKQDLSRERTFAERVAALGSQDGDLTALIHANARRNVDDTFETLNEQVLEDVAQCLSHAGTTLVVAAGASHGAGSYLASSLQIIGVRTVLVTGVADAAPALATLGSGDVVVGLSLWRYLASTVEIVAHAKQDAGATTVVLTDSAVSSATQSADHVLVASASTVGPRLSMTGLIALTEVIVARTALVDPRRSRAAAARASDLCLHGYILGDPAPRPSQESRWSWAERLEEEIGRA